MESFTPPLFTESYSALEPPTDTVVLLDSLVCDLHEEYLLVPEHQRGPDAWPLTKRQKYIGRLRESERGSHPPGSISTYQLITNVEKSSPVWINDGFQRLTTLSQMKREPELYGLNQESAHALLRQTISRQHRHYDSHPAAMRDFQLINNGTHLTSSELCQGFLKYMDGYKDIWKPMLDSIEDSLQHSEARVRSKSGRGNTREQDHKRLRHTLALFYRFLGKEKSLVSYDDVSAKDIQKYLDKGTVIELRLSTLMEEIGPATCRKRVNDFINFMNIETALLEECLMEILGNGTGLSAVTHRWLLDVAVWRKNNDARRELHKIFIEKLLDATQGSAQWISKNETERRRVVTFRHCAIGVLPTLAAWAGVPELCLPPRRKRAPGNLRSGWDNSHVLPFVSHGEGPTSPESAAMNRSRQAHPRPSHDDASGLVT